MKKPKKEKNKKIKIFAGMIILSFLIIFYFRQQYVIIKLQKEINNLCNELYIEKNKNKELVLTFQSLITSQRLENYAKQLNFVPINQNDYIVVK